MCYWFSGWVSGGKEIEIRYWRGGNLCFMVVKYLLNCYL